jgi:cysteinyl-tRNA synthetase
MFLPKSYLFTIKRLNHEWVKPEGYDTGIKVFNCVTKNKQPLIVKNKNCVTWYTCGPTVYDSSHIGHASCFLKLDIIQRVLRQHFKLNLVTVMNITDIDDKIIARSNALKISTKELAKQFEREFWRDLDALEISRPNCVMRVTENLDIIKEFIRKLVDNKKAYQAENGSVYFDVGAYGRYGKLQNLGEEDTVSSTYKKSNMDFALWKAAKQNEVYWESPWGPGRPGWHIECSALASHVFGSELDIHAGGIDLRFPHHENEEAQSCCLHQKNQWVNYWLHTGHLHLTDCEKMSKSLKNTITIGSLLETTTPQVFRMACLMSHYRSSMEFSFEFMSTASNVLKNYINFIDNCNSYLNGHLKSNVNSDVVNDLLVNSVSRIHDALQDDFNTPVVIKILNEITSKVNSILHPSETGSSKSVSILAVSNFVTQTLHMFGINVDKKRVSDGVSNRNFEEVMNILNDFRKDVRQLGIFNKDQEILKLCDNVRNDLKKCGITVKDHGKLSSWS